MKTILPILFLPLLGQLSFAQQVSLSDVLPLNVGNQWTYTFNLQSWYDWPHSATVDSGTADYSIIDMTEFADSSRWHFVVRRNFSRSRYPNWSPFPFQDSATFELVELKSDVHEVYAPVFDQYSVFPFKREQEDSSRFFRYKYLDTSNVLPLDLNLPNIVGSVPYQGTLLLSRDTGILRSHWYQFMPAVGRITTDYYLQAFQPASPATVLTQGSSKASQAYYLYQNYPNPFNPKTTITFHVAYSSDISLRVFDTLGREVAVLIDGAVGPGKHELLFDGSRLASGVYICRLTVGAWMQSRSLLLLK